MLINPGLREDLIDEVEQGGELSPQDASKVYPVEAEAGAGIARELILTSHLQYRMDLRSVTVESLRGQISALRQERDKNAKIAEHLDEYKAQVARLQEELERAKALLPNDREIDDLLKSVANLGKKVGLQFLLFRPMPDVPRDFYAEVPVEISPWICRVAVR